MAVTGKDTLMTNVQCHSACSAVCLPDNAFVVAPLWTAISGFESLVAAKSMHRLTLISHTPAELFLLPSPPDCRYVPQRTSCFSSLPAHHFWLTRSTKRF